MRAQEFVDEMALPADWDESMLGHDKSFRSRLEYALQRSKRLRGGSSRTAFIIPDQGRETVLKIAKNRKGLAQNKVELSILKDGYLGKLPIVIPLIDYDKKNPEPIWIQTEKAQKVSEAQICELLKCKSLAQFVGYVRYVLSKPSGQIWQNVPTVLKKNGYSEQDIETFNDYINEVATLISNSNLVEADFWSAGNWGVFNGRPVIIDLGYDEEVAAKYYGWEPRA